MDRVKTGIKGFDELIADGFPAGSVILLSGTPATGKTIFALQYLFNGSQKFNEKGLYISFEQTIEELQDQAAQFGWGLKELEKKSMIKIIFIPPSEISKNTIREITEIINENGIKRLVIDSLSTLYVNTPTIKIEELNEFTVKRFICSFITSLKEMKGITSLLISHTSNDSQLSQDSVSEFICDGIIHIIFESMGGEFSRSLIVRKMRNTDNDEDIHPLEIGKNGLIVHNIGK
ncbi:MAG: ATPase domain-containing protein [archaeon]